MAVTSATVTVRAGTAPSALIASVVRFPAPTNACVVTVDVTSPVVFRKIVFSSDTDAPGPSTVTEYEPLMAISASATASAIAPAAPVTSVTPVAATSDVVAPEIVFNSAPVAEPVTVIAITSPRASVVVRPAKTVASVDAADAVIVPVVAPAPPVRPTIRLMSETEVSPEATIS